MKISTLAVTSLLSSCLLCMAQQATSNAAKASSAIQNKKYAQAEALISPYITGTQPLKDKGYTLEQLHYLNSIALLQQGKFAEAQKAAQTLIKQFPESKWRFKAIFTMAQSHAERRQYEQAMNLYQQQAKRLSAPTRKKQIAEQLIAFAELFTRPADPTDLDSPKPDYQKAYALYKEVLDFECGQELREKTRFAMIQMQQKLNQHAQVEKECLSYLTEFSPSWRGLIGSVQRVTLKKNLKALTTGKNVALVRLIHAEALHKAGRRKEADAYLLELVKLANAKTITASPGLIADATWLRLHTLTKPGGMANDIEEWTLATRDYLKRYPKHIHANKTAYLLGAQLKRHGLPKKALEAYQNYVDDNFNTSIEQNPLTASKENAAAFAKRKTAAQNNKEKAMFAIGSIHAAEFAFDKANQSWNATVKAFPNGAKWADIQRELAELPYRQLIYSIDQLPTDNNYQKSVEQGRDLIDRYIARFPMDKRLSNLLFMRGNIAYTLAEKSEEKDPKKLTRSQDLYRLAIQLWAPLHSKYASSPLSKKAYYKAALAYDSKLSSLEKAMEYYQKANTSAARKTLQQLKQKRLQVSTEKIFHNGEQAAVKLSTRNIEKVTISQYWLDMKSFFLKSDSLQLATALDVDLVEPDHTWEFTVAEYQKHKLINSSIPIPFDDSKPGVCVIKIESKDFTTTTIVKRSDLDIALRSSRQELIALAKNTRTDKPQAKVELIVAQGEKIISKGVTGADGVFRCPLPQDADFNASSYRVLAVDTLGSALSNQSLNNLFTLPKEQAKAWFHTDRQLIRRGDQVRLHGVVRDIKDGSFIYPKAKEYTFSARIGSVLVSQGKVKLSEEGGFSHSFKVPSRAKANTIVCSLMPEDKSHKSFNHILAITQQAEPKGKITLKVVNKRVTMGDIVKGEIRAQYRWGAPIAHRRVKLSLPFGGYDYLTTDKDGKASFEYDTTGIASGAVIRFNAEVETVQAGNAVAQYIIDPLDLYIAAEADKSTMSTGEAFTIKVNTKNAKGKPNNAKITLKVIKRDTADTLKLSDGSTNQRRADQTIHTSVLETNALTGKAEQKVTIEEAGLYILRLEGTDAFGKSSSTETTLNVLGKGSEEIFSLYHHNEKIYDDGKATLQLYSTLKKMTPALMTLETDRIVSHKIIKVKPGLNTLTIPLQARLAPRFRCSIITTHQRSFISCEDIVAISKKVHVTNTITGLTKGKAKAGATLKATIETRNSEGKLIPSLLLFSLNPTQLEKVESFEALSPFTRSAALTNFNMSSSCGFSHQGDQRAVLAIIENNNSNDAGPPHLLGLSNNERADALVKRGKQAFQYADITRAQQLFGEALRINPRNRLAQQWSLKIANQQRSQREEQVRNYASNRGGNGRNNQLVIPDLLLELDQNFAQEQNGFGGGSGNRMFLGGGGINNGVNRNATNFNSPVNNVLIPGIPQSGSITNAPTSGLRSGDTAITRDSINFFLNNPTRNAQSLQAQQYSSMGNLFDNYANRSNVYSYTYGTGANDELGFDWVRSPQSNFNQPVSFAGLFAGIPSNPTFYSFTGPSVLPSWGSDIVLSTGKSTVDIPLPKQTGRWLLHTNAFDPSGRQGLQRTLIDTTSPYTITLDHQGSLTEGDTFAPSVTLFRAKAGNPQKASFKLVVSTPEGNIKQQTLNFSFTEEEQSKTMELDKLTIANQPWIQFFFNQQQGDIEQSYRLPIRSWGAKLQRSKTLAITAGTTATVELDLPEGAQPGQLHLALFPEIESKFIQLAEQTQQSFFSRQLLYYESQPGGQLLALTATLNYLKSIGAAGSKRYALLEQKAAWLHTELLSSMQSNGSWSLVKGRSQSNTIVTAQAYQALQRWKNLTGANDSYDKTATWLQNQYAAIGDKRTETRCYIQMALSYGDMADFSLCNRLFRDRGKLSSAGKIFLARAFVELERDAFAQTLLKEISLKKPTQWTAGESPLNSNTSFLLGNALQLSAALKAKTSQQEWYQTLLQATGSQPFPDDLTRGAAVAGLAAAQKAMDNNKAKTSKGTGKVFLNDKLAFAFDLSKPDSLKIKPLPATTNAKVRVNFKGQGRLYLSASLTGTKKGFPAPLETDSNKSIMAVNHRHYYHSGLSYKGKPLQSEGRTKAKVVEQEQAIKVYLHAQNTISSRSQSVIVEPIPAGFSYIKGSLKGNHSGARMDGNNLIITLKGYFKPRWFSYRMVAREPGSWKHLPSSIVSLGAPEKPQYGPPGMLTVTPVGVKTTDVYTPTKQELYELTTKSFNLGDYQTTSTRLAELLKKYPDQTQAQIAKIQLWLETAKDQPDPKTVVDAFETLNAKMPELNIDFDKILKVGAAYASLQEYERAHYVFAATIDGGYDQDAYVGVALEDQGKLLDAIDYQKQLWYAYPNSDNVNSAWFAMAQNLYNQANKATRLTPRKGKPNKKITTKEVYREAIEMMKEFITNNPEHPSAAEASYTIGNALFALHAYADVAAHAAQCEQRYPKSELLNSFRYMNALGCFWQRKYDEAIKAAAVVAQGDSNDKDLATFITAQIYHAKGMPKKALQWYEKIENKFPDAKDSIQFFEQKKIHFDEVQVVNSRQKVQLKLNYRNIKEAEIKVYRVDLMKLYLKQKNLSNITKINLAGISPQHEITVKLNATDLTKDAEKTIELPMQKDGAYLIICRGDYLYTSGLALITPLKMQVQEFPAAGSLRVNITDKTTDQLLDNVHVRAIGSGNSVFQKGTTDLRGVWAAQELRGIPTVIAKDEQGRYAFFRGKQSYTRVAARGAIQLKELKSLDYNENLNFKQDKLIKGNWKSFDEKRRKDGKNKGINVNKAIKK